MRCTNRRLLLLQLEVCYRRRLFGDCIRLEFRSQQIFCELLLDIDSDKMINHEVQNGVPKTQVFFISF